MNLAQNDLRTVGVCPSDNDESEEWFYSPHKCHENLVEIMASEDDLEGCENAGDDEVLENDDNIGENWVGYCQETLMKILPTNETIEEVKISPTVDVPGYGAQYKSTIVRLLNENPKLSNDRLVRVRQNATQASDTKIHDGRHYVSLFEDYAYVSLFEDYAYVSLFEDYAYVSLFEDYAYVSLFEDYAYVSLFEDYAYVSLFEDYAYVSLFEDYAYVSLFEDYAYVSLFEDYAYVSNVVVKVGKAQRMRKKFQKGHTEYRNPVDIRDKENVSVSVILKPYQL